MKNRDSNRIRREERQAQAVVRKELADKRSPADQLARLDAAHLTAAKERIKLAQKTTEVVFTPDAQLAETVAKKGKKGKAKKNG